MTFFFVRKLHSKQPAKSGLRKTGQMSQLHKMEKKRREEGEEPTD